MDGCVLMFDSENAFTFLNTITALWNVHAVYFSLDVPCFYSTLILDGLLLWYMVQIHHYTYIQQGE